MEILVIGAGMMGRAITFDLLTHSNFKNITLADKNKETIESAKQFLDTDKINFQEMDVDNKKEVATFFKKNDIIISAIPYFYNYFLTQTSIKNNVHFLDLGGNNRVVEKQRSLFTDAKDNDVTVIHDCGLAPGLTSVLTSEIVDSLDHVDSIKIRVGGLPQKPQPPLNYMVVFSPHGLFNEYLEDAIVLDNGRIVTKKSMTEIENIQFSEPFGKLEAFITSGGCSTIPHTLKDKIDYLDYKTIRYPGHCEKFKELLDLNSQIIPSREELISKLYRYVPTEGKDVVLIKILISGMKENEKVDFEYEIIDYYDEKNNITAMMRTTGYPVSIIAQMIQQGNINIRGVFGNEEIVPPKLFIKELEKRNIRLEKKG